MKVSELIAMLSKLDGNMDVVTPDLLPITAVDTESFEQETFVIIGDFQEDDEDQE